ncbi:uncharacterized protein FTOL_05597 [Fusarium torulosum]|uniref:Uncharacterized protein n=1 Tax=Fusarium torulosum TaxID=33205 RepID=A0AAE8M7J3_9HYPO|nr:uncharacterized protein FTOL_05597 [Fusarium torulosum]
MVRSRQLTKEELFAKYGRGEALRVVYFNELQLLRAQIERYDATLEYSRKRFNGDVEQTIRDEIEQLGKDITSYEFLGRYLQREIRRAIMRRDEF